MDEAVVSKEDARVELKTDGVLLTGYTGAKFGTEFSNTMTGSETDPLTAPQIEVFINGRHRSMEVLDASVRSGISFVTLSVQDSDMGPVQVVTIDCIGGNWQPRQVVYSYTFDDYHDIPGLIHFLL